MLNTICKNIGFCGKIKVTFYEVIHMSFVKNDNQQLTFLDSTFNFTEREKRMLENHGQKLLQTKFFLLLMKTFFCYLQ